MSTHAAQPQPQSYDHCIFIVLVTTLSSSGHSESGRMDTQGRKDDMGVVVGERSGRALGTRNSCWS